MMISEEAVESKMMHVKMELVLVNTEIYFILYAKIVQ